MEKPQHSICDAIRMAGTIANVIDWTHAQLAELFVALVGRSSGQLRPVLPQARSVIPGAR